jgi:hypothetical protein
MLRTIIVIAVTTLVLVTLSTISLTQLGNQPRSTATRVCCNMYLSVPDAW